MGKFKILYLTISKIRKKNRIIIIQKNLKNYKKKNIKNRDFEKVTVHNISNENIPKNILESFELGLSHFIGGKPRKI